MLLVRIVVAYAKGMIAGLITGLLATILVGMIAGGLAVIGFEFERSLTIEDGLIYGFMLGLIILGPMGAWDEFKGRRLL